MTYCGAEEEEDPPIHTLEGAAEGAPQSPVIGRVEEDEGGRVRVK